MIFWVAIVLSDIGQKIDSGTTSIELQSQGRKVADLVRANFFDSKIAEKWYAMHGRYFDNVRDSKSFADATRHVLAELKSSHTGYFTDDDVEYFGLRSIFAPALNIPPRELDGIGADFTADGFARTLFVGGPAMAAGLKRGDQVVAVDGRPFHPVRSFIGHAGRQVVLDVRRTELGPKIQLAVRPRRIEPKKEWLAAQRAGSRLVSLGGKTIAYVPMFACAGNEFQDALKDSLAGDLATADALVIDFRNGWGGCNPNFVSIFDRAPPRLTSVDRNGRQSAMDGQWRKPLVLLINSGSRSGKEAVAFSIRKHKLGILVGERTAGAVVAGRCFPLSDHSLLYLAVADVRVDGIRLEGCGVEPDIAAADHLRFANGSDPQLEMAFRVAAK